MSAKHTPGPWGLSQVEDRSIRHLVPIDRERTSLLTVVYEGGYDGGEATAFAAVYSDDDARLIAAAPELLNLAFEFEAFAEAAMNDADEEGDALGIVTWSERLRKARAAIAKATGSAA